MFGKLFSLNRTIFLVVLAVIMLAGYILDKSIIIKNAMYNSSLYLDVDKVYQHYFADFNLSDLAEKEIKTELKMIVNAVVFKQSNDKNFATLLYVSEQIAEQKIALESIRYEIGHIDTYIRNYKEAETKKYFQNTAISSDIDIQDSDTNCYEFVDYIRDQERIVERFHLPYHIDNSAIQVMDLRENRFLKFHPDKPEKMYDQTRNETSKTAIKSDHLESIRWQPADIVLGHTETRDARLSIQGYWNHVGIYNSQCHCIIDVWPGDSPDFPGGVRKSSWKFWAGKFSEIAIVRLDEIPISTREQIEKHAAKRIGESYNLTTHKRNPEGGWYCSKLIYWIYLQEGIELDSSGGVAVFPDDLAMFDRLNRLTCLDLQ